jgi:GWxTD domain-containing protein
VRIRSLLVVLPVVLAFTRPPAPTAQFAPELACAAARFWRPGDSTRIELLCRVPYVLLEPLPRAGAGYRLTVDVTDSAGHNLLARRWSRGMADAALDDPDGAAVEHAGFTGAAGRYVIHASLLDSASRRVVRLEQPVAALGGAPAVSDLVLATDLRISSSPDSAAADELRFGAVALAAPGWPLLAKRRGSSQRVAYYFEAYGAAGAPALTLSDSAGAPVALPPARELAPGAGLLDVASLPAGNYTVTLVVGIERRNATLRVSDPTARAGADSPVDRFGPAGEALLDSLYAPLIYLMADAERGIYPTLAADGKRRFLRAFWARRDPTPGTPRNEAEEDFYERIAQANRRFREGGAGQIPGWRTDRGRIFLKYGDPDEVLSRPQPGFTLPFEVWKYTRGKLRKFCFMDLTRFGNYSLIYTNDITEASRPNWRELLGADAWDEVLRF